MRSVTTLTLVVVFLIQSAGGETVEDCKSGQHFKNSSGLCERCPHRPHHHYSGEKAEKCKECDPNSKCFCDTTSPSFYNYKDDDQTPIPECMENGLLRCDNGCYDAARFKLTAEVTGYISDRIEFLNCSCSEAVDPSDCLNIKNFTNNCLLSDCKRIYENEPCFTLEDCNETCYKKLTDIWPGNGSYCNCYSTKSSAHTEICADMKVKMEKKYNECLSKHEPPPITVILLLFLAFLALIFLGGIRYSLIFTRKLKRRGELQGILPYIDWNKVEPLGAIMKALERHGTTSGSASFHLYRSHKEIVFKVPFSPLNSLARLRILRPQYVVIKMFSKHRLTWYQQERAIFEKLDPKIASKYNIISVYGPSTDYSEEEPLSVFLGELVRSSPRFTALKETFSDCYINGGRYMIMNHCNSLSLRKHLEGGNNNLNPSHMIKLCQDLAQALNFLQNHDLPRRKAIIHCDVKADNVFVKARRKKTSFILGDFGMAQEYDSSHGRWRTKGFTPMFYPPEYLYDAKREESGCMSLDALTEEQRSMCTELRDPRKIDVYQYGLVIWQALHGGRQPYELQIRDLRPAPGGGTPAQLKALFAGEFDCRPQFDKLGSHTWHHDYGSLYYKCVNIAKICWQVNVELRPLPNQLLSLIEEEFFASKKLIKQIDCVESAAHGEAYFYNVSQAEVVSI